MVSKMSVSHFDEKTHFPLMNTWLERRSMKPIVSTEYLPPTGYVIYYYSQPVCMGFLIKCDNKMALASDFISDPEIPRDLRNESVQRMRDIMAQYAKSIGLKIIVAQTKIPEHVERLKSLGYVTIETNLTNLGRLL